MAVLQSTNVQGALCVNGVAVGGGKDFKFCCFTASSTFTPSQDLVDGNGFLHADIIAGGGGGGAGSVIGFCHQEVSALYLNSAACNPAPGGFIQDPVLSITATDACGITIGAGGTTGSAIQNSCIYAIGNNNACYTSITAFTSAGAGGNSCFGDYVAYGGQGGTSVERVHNGGLGCNLVTCCAGASADAAVPAYDGQSTGIDVGVDADCAIQSNFQRNCLDINSGLNSPECLQFGGSNFGGKMGASGFRCSHGRCSAGILGKNNPFLMQFTSRYCNSCTGTQGCYGLFCNCTPNSGSVYGSPGSDFCVCTAFGGYGSCRTKMLMSGSGGPGAPGIVVLKWQE